MVYKREGICHDTRIERQKKNNIEGNKKININDYVYLTYIIVVLIILYRNIKKIE